MGRYATKKIVATIRTSLPFLIVLREKEPELKSAIDFLIDGAFYDMDDDYFLAAFGDEKINENYQWFQHRKFGKTSSGHFYSGTLNKFIHVAIWEYYRGEIPKGYVIHHKDFNPANNNLNNLQMMTRSEHNKLHSDMREKKFFVCKYCGKEFYKYDCRPDTENNFCSSICDARWRRLQKLYTEERICKICGKKFSTRKSSKSQVCSPHCRGIVAAQNTKRLLTSEQRNEIRETYIKNDENFGGRALAKKYGVKESVIYHLVNGETYRKDNGGVRFLYEEVSDLKEYEVEDGELAKFRKLFKAAVEFWNKWQKEAKEDYDFVVGKQWRPEELAEFDKQEEPPLVINRVRPLINILSGWEKSNKMGLSFLPRTGDDIELAELREGVTKYVMDKCNFETSESFTFRDCAIGGIGWFEVRYKYDYEADKGQALIERIDPFSVYCDPEAHELDFSDAKFICRARWADKDELIQLFPDKAEEIQNNYNLYDLVEKEFSERVYIDPMWYNSELKKVRVVECWYKEQSTQTVFYTADEQKIPFTEENQEQINLLAAQGLVADYGDIPVTNIRCCTFFDRTMLEDIPSPYQHKQFPYVTMIYEYFGVGDIPAGFVRALKDPQRELNKRRLQQLHLLNTTAGGGGFVEEGAMSPEQFEEFEKKNNIPGHFNKVMPGGISKILEREPKSPPVGIIQAEQQATADLMAISGINENLLGTDIAPGSSGRAIELKQRQSITHLSVIFDALRSAKKKIADLLWGSTGRKGIIPQFYLPKLPKKKILKKFRSISQKTKKLPHSRRKLTN